MAVNVDTRRHMNDHRRRLFEGAGGNIAFLCECGDGDCTRSVVLSPGLFDEVRAKDGKLLHPGHLET